MAKDFQNEYLNFGLDINHVYKLHGEDWQFAYQTNGTVTFSVIDDPYRKATYDIGTLNRMNAAGDIELTPFGQLPEHLRPLSVNLNEDVFIAGLPEAQGKECESRHALVRSFLELKASKTVKEQMRLSQLQWVKFVRMRKSILRKHYPIPCSQKICGFGKKVRAVSQNPKVRSVSQGRSPPEPYAVGSACTRKEEKKPSFPTVTTRETSTVSIA